MRTYRPLDLTAHAWREDHPGASYTTWQASAKQLLLDGLHRIEPPVERQVRILETSETDLFRREKFEFSTTPWSRVPGYFYVPKNVALPAPGMVVLHEWGGPMVFGCDRVSGPPIHPSIVAHREKYTSGVALADMFAEHGYAVVCIDAHHFGARIPRGVGGVPAEVDRATLTDVDVEALQKQLTDLLYLGVRQLNWAGTTWCGVNFVDDRASLDYLCSRPEVDATRIGVTGLSGGGWRTNILAALEDRVKAAVSVGWMTTGDEQQKYNVLGGVGAFCLLPGVWNRIDIPDLIAMAAPKAIMVVSGQQDELFTPRGQYDASKQIEAAYRWAGFSDRVRCWHPDKPHCYDADIQREALAWFDRHLN